MLNSYPEFAPYLHVYNTLGPINHGHLKLNGLGSCIIVYM